jgi:hypothetical protein
MRPTCDSSGQHIRLRGFAGAFPIEDTAPKISGPHFQPPALRQHKLQVVSTATNRTTDLKWFGPSNQGLWRFEGNVEPAGGEVLTLEGSGGSLHTHQLLLTCDDFSAAVGPGQRSRLPSEGLWNVMTTTSANNILPKTLGHLLMLHVQYHARLGFDGTILRCNKGEAQELSLLPHIEALVAANKLIIWPWVSIAGQTPTSTSIAELAGICVCWIDKLHGCSKQQVSAARWLHLNCLAEALTDLGSTAVSI